MSLIRRKLTRRVRRSNSARVVADVEQLEMRRLLTDATVSGFVFLDDDGDGVRDEGERGVPGVLVSLTGTTTGGDNVVRRFLTGDDGSWEFGGLQAGTYQATETQPTALADGIDGTPTAGPVAGDDTYTNIVVDDDDVVAELNFGEGRLDREYLSIIWLTALSQTADFIREHRAMVETDAGNTELATAIREGRGEVDTDLGLNDPPEATDDAYTVEENSTLTVAVADGVLANDSDPEGSAISAQLVQDVQNGTLTLAPDGSFTYEPDEDFFGTDNFTYRASDGFETSAEVTVTLTVTEEVVLNTFTVQEGAAAGSVVGTIMPENVGGAQRIFDFEQPGLDEDLKLVADDHLSGDAASPVVLIEYLDFQCPACRQYHNVIEQLKQNFVGDLLVVSRHLPLNNIHPNAMAAAIAAEAAGVQGQFDEMADMLFDNQDEWSDAADPQSFFDMYAEDLGLNLTEFAADVADPDTAARVTRDSDAAARLGATGTPSFFLNGERIANPAPNIDDFSAVIQEEVDQVDDVFVLRRTTGELLVRDTDALDPNVNPRFEMSVDVRVLNGATETVDVVVNVQPLNTFTVEQGAAVGTEVGTVAPENPLGDDLIFGFEDPTLPEDLKLSVEDHREGDAAASVVVIEYLSFQCPACATYHTVVEQLLQDFDGDLLVVRRHQPLSNIFANAEAAAIASEAAARQGMFEEMANLLFENQADWSPEADPLPMFRSFADQLGLDLTQFDSDSADPALLQRVNRDVDAAARLGVGSTPTFFVNGDRIANPDPATDAFNTLIQDELDSVTDVFSLNRDTGVLEVRDPSALTGDATFDLSVEIFDEIAASDTVDVAVQVVSNGSGSGGSGPNQADDDSLFSHGIDGVLNTV